MKAFFKKIVPLISVGALAFSLLCGCILWRFWDTVIVSDISASNELHNRGWTDRGTADALVGNANRLIADASLGFDMAYPRHEVSDMQYLDQIKFSKFDTSLTQIMWFLDTLLGRKNHVVNGEALTENSNTVVMLYWSGRTSRASGTDRSSVLCAGAKELLGMTEPYVLAASLYAHSQTRRPTDYAEPLKVIDQMIRAGGEEMYSAYTLRGKIRLDQGRFDDARADCKKAIDLRSSDWVGHACLGNVDANEAGLHWNGTTLPDSYKSLCVDADQSFATAEKAGHRMNAAYNLWALCKAANGANEAEVARLKAQVHVIPEGKPQGCAE